MDIDAHRANPNISLERHVKSRVIELGRSLGQSTKLSMIALQLDELVKVERRTQNALTAALADGRWRAEFRGRDILHKFVDRESLKIPYERFRNLIVSRMAEVGHQPAGMRRIIDGIMSGTAAYKINTLLQCPL
jgi:hypothetical protein